MRASALTATSPGQLRRAAPGCRARAARLLFLPFPGGCGRPPPPRRGAPGSGGRQVGPPGGRRSDPRGARSAAPSHPAARGSAALGREPAAGRCPSGAWMCEYRPVRPVPRLPQRVCGRVSVFRVVPLENVRYRVPSSTFLDAASCPSRAFGLTQRVWACWGSRALRGRRTGIRRVEACVGAAGGVCSGLSALGRRDGLCDGVTEPGRPRGARGCGGGAPSAGAGCEHRGGSAAASMMQHRVRPRRRGGSLSVPGSLCCVNASWHTGSFVCRVRSLLCVLFEGDNRTPVPVMAVREGRRCLCSERGVVRRSEVRHLLCSQLRSANYCLQSEKMR